MRWKQLSLVLALSLAGTTAYADTTYNLNFNIGGATAIGTITTDGKTGVLQTGDITGFNVTLAGGGNTSTLFDKTAFISSNDLTATTAGLFYNFDNSTSSNVAYIASDPAQTGDILCVTGDGSCPGTMFQGAVIRLDGVIYSQAASGNVQVGTASSVASSVTPEPSSLALLGTGVLGLYGAARRRFA